MNLLALMLILMALIVAACVFYVAWEFSSGKFEERMEKEPGESKESNDSPGSQKERGTPVASVQSRGPDVKIKSAIP